MGRNMKKIIFTSLLLVIWLTGCDEGKTKTVEYYMQNSDERKTKIAECNSNPGELGMTPNCINASKAAMQIRSLTPDTTDYSKW